MSATNTEAALTQHHFSITAQEAGGRVDAVLAARGLEGLSRSRIKALIGQGALCGQAGKVEDPAQKVKAGEAYCLSVPPLAAAKIRAVSIPFGIVYEDAHLLVVDKPAGLTVHPAAGNYDHTLVNGLLAYCGESLSGIGGEQRPGIVHRLDKDTSGLMVVAKHDAAHQHLSAQLADRSLSRIYMALVWGRPLPSTGTIEAALGRSPSNRKKMAVVKKGGKAALTHYETLQSYEFSLPSGHSTKALFSLIRCRLHTGRTHQIRVHLTHLGYPLVGDPVYGGKTSVRLAGLNDAQLPEAEREKLLGFARQALHAAEIRFVHPVSGEPMHFHCNLPADMAELMDIGAGLMSNTQLD